ncbi:phage tail sheath protein [Corallococcus llansteffanensis]|uniref:Phage tail sheath protein n=1 Tax=Corallococcus llansteffanensis TaxID=2316731 RepID=A0A3A8QHU3_9BACT|nr:phage tail sheath protein [Corallococcus llansteffanensis]RKH68283.1 phage tail sheath protein [Corallococcus llansteffanensis]
MAGGLIIPGVQVTVVKEVLPQQLSPSGVLGLVGFVADPKIDKVVRASSWSRFTQVLGLASTYSLPEARQALDNGISELVISPLPWDSGAVARATITAAAGGPTAFTLVARTPGTWANEVLKVKVEERQTLEGAAFDLTFTLPGGDKVILRNLRPDTLVNALANAPVMVEADTIEMPKAGDYVFSGGKDANLDDYAKALDRLQNEPDVDMVLASIQDFSDLRTVGRIYGKVLSHCIAMSAECKGRIGFGQVPPTGTLEASRTLASNLVSDRFVLVAPHGVVGSVVGKVGGLRYYDSPTFKPVSGMADLPPLVVEDQRALLASNIVPVVQERGRGVIILRGLTTDGDQLNVRRIADRAVRQMKMIGDLFIGLLNNTDGRSALKQKLAEALVQMEKEGAIVPSTDGKDAAFKVEVYSSQADFALGIVRVSLAVRPVRAIDYIYATITVQV